MSQPPINISDIFHIDDSDAEDTEENESGGVFKEEYEVATIQIKDISLKIRQFSWHQTNANKIWPGTYRLAEFITDNGDKYQHSRILELGAATGALSLYLNNIPGDYHMVTSDIDDGGAVESNIAFNFQLNGASLLPHMPFTWGTDWKNAMDVASTEQSMSPQQFQFDYIVASDILLYVSSYPSLVQSLVEMFKPFESLTAMDHSQTATENTSSSSSGASSKNSSISNVSTNSPPNSRVVKEFLMSWNRRIAESKIFFTLMEENGFQCTHHGQCIYSFTRPLEAH